MKEYPLQFLEVPRSDPEKTPAASRIRDFREIYGQYQPHEAEQQAA